MLELILEDTWDQTEEINTEKGFEILKSIEANNLKTKREIKTLI